MYFHICLPYLVTSSVLAPFVAMPLVSNSFLLLLVRHLLLEAMHLLLVSVLPPGSNARSPVRSVLAPSSDALCS